MKQDVLPIILGATDGAYALAHAFFHDYGIVPLVLDDCDSLLFKHTFCAYQSIVKNVRKPDTFYRVAEDMAVKCQGKSLLLIPADGCFLSLVSERVSWLSKMFLLPHLPTPSFEKKPDDVVALALLYRTGRGECRTVYARTLAKSPSGEFTALLAQNIPDVIAEDIKAQAPNLCRGIYLFYIDSEGKLYRDGSVLSPLVAFSAAKDASLPEWMINETVLCEPLPETQEELSALFTLFPYRKTRRFLTRAARKTVRHIQKCSLYSFKEEGVRRDIARVFKALYRDHTAESRLKD